MLCAASLSLPLKNKIQHDLDMGVLLLLEVSWHSKLRGLEMSGHVHYFVYIDLWVCI